jgi:hypothetical protein
MHVELRSFLAHGSLPSSLTSIATTRPTLKGGRSVGRFDAPSILCSDGGVVRVRTSSIISAEDTRSY